MTSILILDCIRAHMMINLDLLSLWQEAGKQDYTTT